VTPEASAEAAPAADQDHFHGLAVHRLSNARLWVDVLATGGPRIVRVGLAGSPRNLLAETPDLGWETPNGRYELFGGHRLWFAPEDPDRVAIPDRHGLVLETVPGGVRLTGQAEPQTGLVRTMVVHVTGEDVEVRHELRNIADRPVELAPWAITQLPLDGTVLLPQRPATPEHRVHPDRALVLWPYTSWEDPRLRLCDGLLIVDARSGSDLKIGYRNDDGWVGYLRDRTLLVRRFEPAVGQPLPDLGCNTEAYVGPRFVELELLGPLARLSPGSTVAFVERWQVLTVDPVGDVVGLRRLAGRIGNGAPPRSSAA
jgi:hypothetical protein